MTALHLVQHRRDLSETQLAAYLLQRGGLGKNDTFTINPEKESLL